MISFFEFVDIYVGRAKYANVCYDGVKGGDYLLAALPNKFADIVKKQLDASQILKPIKCSHLI